MKDYIVHKEIQINATPDEVWKALTDPEKTKEYFFNCEVISDWQPGSSIVFKGKMFFLINIEMKGEIVDVIPGKLLKYTLLNESDDKDNPGVSTVTDKLTYNNGVTTLSITDDVGHEKGAAKRLNRSEKGWDKVLKGLKDLVENN